MKTNNNPILQTVPFVDLDKYAGKWYEIAAFPQRFEKGCNCTTAEYEVTKRGFVRVINKCRLDSVNGKVKTAKGKAFPVLRSNNAKLKVQFFWPFKGDYWVIELADDYSYAMVGESTRKYLWILGRTPKMADATYQMLVTHASEKGFDVRKLKKTVQTCN